MQLYAVAIYADLQERVCGRFWLLTMRAGVCRHLLKRHSVTMPIWRGYLAFLKRHIGFLKRHTGLGRHNRLCDVLCDVLKSGRSTPFIRVVTL